MKKDLQLFDIAKHVVGGEGIGGGGCDLRTGRRDNDWTVDSRAEAEMLKHLLLDAKIAGLEVRIDP